MRISRSRSASVMRGAFDGQRRAVGNGAQQFALGGQPFVGPGKTDQQYADGLVAVFQRHAPQRARMGTQNRAQPPLGTMQVRQKAGSPVWAMVPAKPCPEVDAQLLIQ